MFDLPTFRTDILDSVAYIVASMRHREPEISHEICRLTWDFLVDLRGHNKNRLLTVGGPDVDFSCRSSDH